VAVARALATLLMVVTELDATAVSMRNTATRSAVL
jgi:hypothetical protein